MFEFKIGNIYRAYSDNRLLGDDFLDAIANTECEFKLQVHNQIIIDENHWNLVEFLDQLIKWNEEGLNNSFKYECMDSDEDDLFEFRKDNGRFIIFSSRMTATEKRSVTKREILDFIHKLKSETIENIQNSLGIDLTQIDGLRIR